MGKSKKPWLNYGRGDGLDKVEPVPIRSPKKYSTAVWCFLLFNGIGGHRLYVEEYRNAFRWFLITLGLQIIPIPLLIIDSDLISNYSKVYVGVLTIFYFTIIVWEFRSIRPSIDRINRDIEEENGKRNI